MSLFHGPTGKTVRGHVLDVALKPFLRALTDLDDKLYVRWNPAKIKGWGCWEIRRKPSMKTPVYMGKHLGVSYYKLMYLDERSTHHVLDCAFLNYDQIRKLKEMDTWSKSHWIHSMDSREQDSRLKQEAKAAETLAYAIRQNKSAIRDLYQMVASGESLDDIVKSSKWS